jgi:CHASE2 domain-containing sensor protein
MYFPLGLCRVFFHDLGSAPEYWWIFSYFGWSVFLVLMAAGLQHPRRVHFAVLVLLLIINALAYPTADVANHAKPWFL